MTSREAPSGKFTWSGYVLGFALGGFFDGILLHQVLQWHHLLSLVDGAGGIRDQIVYDGLFHLLMYAVAIVGLVLLARSRVDLDRAGAGRRLLVNTLVGFGVWQFVDVGLAHWLMGIHRVRLDTPNPLFWDVAWLFVFGIIPLIAAWLLARGRGGPPIGGRAAAVSLVLAVLIGGPWAARPPSGSDGAMVVFRPGISDAEAWNAVAQAGGSVLWQSQGIWAVRFQGEDRAAGLYAGGAMLVSSSFGGGCLAWSKA